MKFLASLLVVLALTGTVGNIKVGAFQAVFQPVFPAAKALPQSAACQDLPPLDWSEAKTAYFSILVPSGEESFGASLLALQSPALDAEYERFHALFGTDLQLPLTIRVYPTHADYSCLNAGAPTVPSGSAHSHIGSREIALLLANIPAGREAWLAGSLDAFRYELAVLFGEAISGQKAPPGLLAAIGHYAQDPARTIGILQLNRRQWQVPDEGLAALWEDPATAFNLRLSLQATSTVAYLLDRLGWDPFIAFLKDLAASGGYRQSLAKTYAADFSTLEKEWMSYYPNYFFGRWQANLLYNYDLSPYQALIQEEKYAEAITRLNEVTPFLKRSGQPAGLGKAQGLLALAATGQEANHQAAEAEQSLWSGDYQAALDLAREARQKFSQTGNYHRLDALDAFTARVQTVLSVHAELDQVRQEVEASSAGPVQYLRLSALGRRLHDLGDPQGEIQVRQVAQTITLRLQNQQVLVSLVAAVLVIGLLALRLWLLRRRPPLEAQL